MNSSQEEKTGVTPNIRWRLLKKVAPFIAGNKRAIQFFGLLVMLVFAGYSYWQYEIKIEKKTAEKIEDARMITDYIKNDVIRVMSSGRFQNLETAYLKIKTMVEKKGISVSIYRSDGREAFSDKQTSTHVLDLAVAAMEYGEKTFLGSMVVSEVIAEAEAVLKRKRPDESKSLFEMPGYAHDKDFFAKALANGESEDNHHHDLIERFIRIDRQECGDACHMGEDAIIKMTINKKDIGEILTTDLEWDMARVAVFFIGLLLVIGLFGKLDEINREEREREREDYLENLEVAYDKLSVLTQEVSIKSDEVAKYGNEMEQLAEERSKQLIHAERMSTLGIMSAGVAHEINNPTAFIRNYANMLKIFWDQYIREIVEKSLREEDGDTKKLGIILEEMPRLINSLEEGTDRIIKIVEGLKDFSRQKEAVFELRNICDCIEEALTLSKFNTTLKNEVKIESDLSSDIPEIMLNRQEIEQVLINLFTNAAHALEGLKDARLNISAKKNEKDIVVVVDDNGVGMDKETLNKIFTPFFTTKIKKGGTGLGLSICYGIIEKHGGVIEADSSPGKGTSFTIRLPIQKK